MPRRVTVRDIAREAKVHYTTVARGLKNHPSISEKVCAQVQKIAKELGYTPDPMITALSAYRQINGSHPYKSTIAWITNGPTRDALKVSETYNEYLAGARERAREVGYEVEEFWLREPGMTPRRATQILTARNITGLLIAPQINTRARIKLDWSLFTAVTFGYTLGWPQLHLVTNHQFRSMITIMRNLRRLGYQRVGFAHMGFADERVNHGWSAGFWVEQNRFPSLHRVPPLLPKRELTRKALTEWYLEYRPEVIISVVPWIFDWAREMKLRVPEDVGIAFTTVRPHQEEPQCAGIDEHMRQTGAIALDHLVSLLHQQKRGIPDFATSILVEGSWVPGKTVCRQNNIQSTRALTINDHVPEATLTR